MPVADPSISFLCRNCRFPLAGVNEVTASPIPHLLGTNRAPSEREACEVRNYVASLQPDLSRLDSDIVQVQRVLENLKEEREALSKSLDEHRNFLTPARRMPPANVWCEIFYHCLPSARWYRIWEPDPLFAFRPKHAPALLLRICTDWTNIVLSTPQLWSSIMLKPFGPEVTLVASSLVQTWLRRSQQASLSVSFIPCGLLTELVPFLTHPAVRAVFEQSHRWKSVSMELLPSMEYCSLLEDNLPVLQELNITFLNDSAMGLPRPVDHFKGALNLHRVKLGGLSPSITDIKLPLAQLTHFSNDDGCGGTLAEFLTLLKSATVLQKVEWLTARVENSQFHSSLLIRHSYLRILRMSFDDDPGNFFDYLSFPSLRGLTIHQNGHPWSCLPFGSFFIQCPSLKRLCLRGVGLECFQHSELVTHLKALHSLSHLDLTNSIYVPPNTVDDRTGWTSVDQLLQSLRYNATDTEPILPQLVSLLIDESSVSCIDKFVARFVEVVESRFSLPITPSEGHAESTVVSRISRLKAASLILGGHTEDIIVDPTGLDRLRNMKSEGLKLQLSLFDYESYEFRHLV